MRHWIPLFGVLLLACSGHGAAAPTVKPSPAPDLVAQRYVALVHDFWVQEMAADVATDRSNLAAKVCLGTDPPGAATRPELIDPPMCRDRAVALLAVHQKFLSDLDGTPAPPKFAADDQVLRTQIARTLVDLNTLIAAAASGDKNAVLQAATAYNKDMYPAVTDALNDVDPSVTHP